MFDLKISGGSVIDGTGRPAVRADVGLTGGRVADVGDLSRAEAREDLDARGRTVCPGFIDAHSHSDAYLLVEPSAPSKIHQGVTTEVIGNCGASAAPHFGPARLPSDWQTFEYPGAWRHMAEYRALLERVGPAVNVVALVGHNVLRAGVMGYEGRAATADELAAMGRRLEESLDAGARGLSTGLIYPPGMYATTAELGTLARVTASRGGIYTSHMRSEGRQLIEALEETLAIGRSTGVRVQVSHLKTSGKANWPLIERALDTLERARADGVEVAADRYPYLSSCTELDVIFPDWATEGGRDAELARLRDPATRARLRGELLASRPADAWGIITIGSSDVQDGRFRGRTLCDAAAELGLDPVEAALHLIEADELRTSAFFQGMCEENLWRILAQPYVMLGSDASVRAPWGPLSRDYPHPRAYGSFPRFLRAALEGRTVPVEEAVRKMTSLAADHFRLADRGRLLPGQAGDVTVFDPGALADRSTYAAPHRLAEGVVHVVVNGTPTLVDGALTGRRSGAWL
jgi:N-acyl-D-amino-acid deacylase